MEAASRLWKLLVALRLLLSAPFRLLFRIPSLQPVEGNEQEDPRKLEFFSIYKDQYGYPQDSVNIDQLRKNEFPQLKGDTYLDHAGATLYSSSQIRSVLEDLSGNLYGNPHSQSGCSVSTTNAVANAREEVLRFFNAPAREYKCIFTSGATGALKLVGENFPWTSSSSFWYTMENHNSVLGIREYALQVGASVHAVDIEDSCDIVMNSRPLQMQVTPVSQCDHMEGSGYHLFAFPSECNFSGRKFDLNLIKFVQEAKHTKDIHGRWLVLLDAAKGCATSYLDLSKYPADFVTISFYKIFGYPTGLGALLVRSDAANLLQKKYFGGGTVAASVADSDYVKRRESIEQWLEDGTLSFLGILSLRMGFATIKRLGISNISRHAGCLANFTASQLSKLQHKNGYSVCVLYGRHSIESKEDFWGFHYTQGPMVTFNLKRPDGTWIGYREVEKLASLNGIHLRTGCFCNPGACSKYLGLVESEIRANHEAGHVCWDDHDIIDGKPVGAVRVSFGYMSAVDDCLVLLNFISEYFVDIDESYFLASLNRRAVEKFQDMQRDADNGITLKTIMVYPIKSCAGFHVDSWLLGSCGLLYDREWVVMDSSGTPLTQKKCPTMCLIRTSIDLSRNKLIVWSSWVKKRLEIPLGEPYLQEADVGFKLCGDSPKGKSCEKDVADWFTEALGTECAVVRKGPSSRHLRPREESSDLQTSKDKRELSFANEGQFLLISLESVGEVDKWLMSSKSSRKSSNQNNNRKCLQVDALRFRPNFIISGGYPFEEDDWKSLLIGREKFDVLGGCNRCQMVNIDQAAGKFDEGSNLLLTLASYRRIKGKILFGVLLAQHPSKISRPLLRSIKVGSVVYPETDVCL